MLFRSVAEKAIDPLHQFEIVRLIPAKIGNLDVSFTNASLWMVIAIAAVTVFLVGGMRRQALVPGRWQSMAELSYEFIAGMIQDNVGSSGKKFFPFIFTLFVFTLFGNILGMLPYGFTFTSHIAVTFFMAMVVFLGVTLIGLFKHGLHF